ncbi:MAG: AAA ATPase [Candidatus Magnetoglobus multicellularis str. Araruama]|uniref:AAA ATPase n=1 Tax=Candidatus Magnetoglobus multicellularis str. Araruama TaxID=890399 RepID=A0A1V1NZQ1_9BACT|nr:MAG: AAA ATPase [Candidatus Magnetoglobus multicellularis str. Araruama]
MIKYIEINNITVFDHFKTDLSTGINIFIGENGTGKTHLLKLLYAVQSAPLKGLLVRDILQKLLQVFLPYEDSLKRLVRRMRGEKREGKFTIGFHNDIVSMELINKKIENKKISGHWYKENRSVVFIPVKEMLSNSPGFRSLFKKRDISFEEIYDDIIAWAFLPPLKKIGKEKKNILTLLKKTMGGQIIVKNEAFFLKTKKGEIEFHLVAEGMRKLALLWLLIRNGTLEKGATLYWDEPEANLNPSLMHVVVEVLLALERIGVQIFIATHSYVIIKEFELQRDRHSMCFFSLYKDENDSAQLNKSQAYHNLVPNKISDAFTRIYDLEIEQAMEVK